MLGDALLHLGQRLAAGEVHVEVHTARVAKMQMRVVEAGHDKVSAQIHDRGAVALELADFVVGADGDDAAIAHGEGLCARRRRLGIDIAVEEDGVGRMVGGGGVHRHKQ